MWKDVKENTPVELFREIELMDLPEKTKFMLNACNSDYIREWKSMFDAMSNFICNTYMIYKDTASQT